MGDNFDLKFTSSFALISSLLKCVQGWENNDGRVLNLGLPPQTTLKPRRKTKETKKNSSLQHCQKTEKAAPFKLSENEMTRSTVSDFL